MRTLLVGYGASYHVGAFLRAGLEALGAPHAMVDVSRYELRPGRPLAVRAASRLSGHRSWMRWRLNREILRVARAFRPGVVLVNGGAFMAPPALARLKAETGAVLVNWALDDPFNPRHRTRGFLAGIPLYDVYATCRRAVIPDLERAGCRKAAYVRVAYEPSIHFPEPPVSAEDHGRFDCDVLFAGGADKDRYPLMRRIAGIPGVRLRLYGGFWERDSVLAPLARGFAYGADYRRAIGGARISLGLVRRANRDGHVMRSYEIPACGGFMIADRTEEHLELFAEDREAAFFGSDDELVGKIGHYLAHDGERRAIAEAGRAKVTAGGNTYRDRLQELLGLAEASR